ncbi:hypothetical protein [Enhygromyxa salina]|uniref:hypothetical protein n=1 Tax=Enhygromyxa salina TaxID=215803 RepID=UPI0011B26C81|nr:hypothetical protein [Enhygromyxa salina]
MAGNGVFRRYDASGEQQWASDAAVADSSQVALADHFMTACRELLSSTKRMLVDLRHVSDPEYRAELAKAGVKASPVNKSLHGSPGVSGHEILRPKIRPKRGAIWPKFSRLSPLAGAANLRKRAPRRRRPARGELTASPQSTTSNRGRVALGVAAGSVVLTAAGLWGLSQMTED